MEKDEKLQTVPILHMQGNALVKQRKFREAASKYKEAVLLLKTVQSRVSEWLERKKGIWEEKWVMCRLVYFELWAFLGHATLALFQWGIPVFLFCSASLCLWLQAVGWEAVDDCLDGGILEGECVQDVLIKKKKKECKGFFCVILAALDIIHKFHVRHFQMAEIVLKPCYVWIYAKT